jgi:phosphoethanolamine N-methyltransferase
MGMLELVWGEGWLSPGGQQEVATAINDIDFHGETVLDIGCGVGEVDFLLIENHDALHVTGIDVEDAVLVTARRRAEARKLAKKCGFVKV